MYYGETSRRKMEKVWVTVFMCATLIFLWMLMLKVDFINKNSEKESYKAEKLSTNYEENVEKDRNNTSERSIIEDASKSVVGISKLENSGIAFYADDKNLIGVGSGVLISENGYILTNEHVAGSKYSNVYVTLENGAKYNSNVIWSDTSLDLAIIKIPGENFNYLNLGDSDRIFLGENVYAIGNPIGAEFQRTVTKGIISGKNRTIKIVENDKEMYMEDLIQTDATINNGNSGGPLINDNGELLGINTVKISGVDGIGFSIPINIIKPLLELLEKDGNIPESYLGIYAFDKEVIPYLKSDLKFDKGIYVVSIDNQESLSGGNIMVGDIIEKVDGIEVNKMNELRKIIYTKKPGELVKLEINRNGQHIEIESKIKSKN
ncbi:MAG: trypsin-like peptidase domain-containing protein [Clostridia bacterium]|nr:trypsin-like peptidase domain-containing protein [Clostridia bacterium]